ADDETQRVDRHERERRPVRGDDRGEGHRRGSEAGERRAPAAREAGGEHDRERSHERDGDREERRRDQEADGHVYSSAISPAKWSWTTLRRSLSVGVSSPSSSEISRGTIANRLICSTRVRSRFTPSTTSCASSSGSRPEAATSAWSSAMSAVTYRRRSPITTACETKRDAFGKFSRFCGAMFWAAAEIMRS